MADALEFVNKLSGVGFGTLLAFIIVGSYFEVWVWGRQLKELKAECSAKVDKEEAEKEKWMEIAMRATGMAETSVNLKSRV